MPKITIIIPNYNNAKYLERCLESVINQTYKDLEIICVDDKSTDGSVIILKKYAEKDKRIQLLLLSANCGVSTARNMALKIMTGEYVCFLDSDDCLERTSCKDLLDSIIKRKSDMAFGGHVKINSLSKKVSAWLPKKEISQAPKVDVYDFTKHRNVTQKLFKTSIIKEHNIIFNTELNYMEDAVFLMEYLSYCKVISGVKKVLYNVQINFHSLCRNKEFKERRENDSKKAFEIINKF